jgi:hypothetical protein
MAKKPSREEALVTNHRQSYERLAARRLRAAEHRLRCYDFGHDVAAEGSWMQLGRDGGHWRRRVKLQADGTEQELIFAVTFALNTNHMIEAYALTPGDVPLLVGQWSDVELRSRH